MSTVSHGEATSGIEPTIESIKIEEVIKLRELSNHCYIKHSSGDVCVWKEGMSGKKYHQETDAQRKLRCKKYRDKAWQSQHP